MDMKKEVNELSQDAINAIQNGVLWIMRILGIFIMMTVLWGAIVVLFSL